MERSKKLKMLHGKYIEARRSERQEDIKFKELLITQIKENPCIWDMRLLAHRDRMVVEAAWEKIATITGKKHEGAPADSPVGSSENATTECSEFVHYEVSLNDETDGLEMETFTQNDDENAETDMIAGDASDTDKAEEDGLEIPTSKPKSENSHASATKKGIKKPIRRGKKKQNEDTDNQILEAIKQVDRQIERQPADSVSHFLEYLGNVLRQIPSGRQRTSMQLILQVANYCVDAANPVSKPKRN